MKGNNNRTATAIYTAYEDFEEDNQEAPEKGLLLAILFGALTDLKQPGRVGRMATDFFLNRDEKYIYSFKSICTFLSIDPRQVLMVAGLENDINNKFKSSGNIPIGAIKLGSKTAKVRHSYGK